MNKNPSLPLLDRHCQRTTAIPYTQRMLRKLHGFLCRTQLPLARCSTLLEAPESSPQLEAMAAAELHADDASNNTDLAATRPCTERFAAHAHASNTARTLVQAQLKPKSSATMETLPGLKPKNDVVAAHSGSA